MSDLLSALDTYDSPVDMTELARSYDVIPTALAEFVHASIAGNQQPASVQPFSAC